MSQHLFPITDMDQYRMAGPTDLIQLLPAPGANALFIPKSNLEILFSGLTRGELIHLSSATGSGKTSLIEAIVKNKSKLKAFVLSSSRAVYGEGTHQCPEHGMIFPEPRSTG